MSPYGLQQMAFAYNVIFFFYIFFYSNIIYTGEDYLRCSTHLVFSKDLLHNYCMFVL